jgi:hypothetical protein
MSAMSKSMVSLGGALLVVASAAFLPEGHAQTARSGDVTIGASGDLLAHIRVVRAAAIHGWDHVLGQLRSFTSADDISFANLETPLSEERPVASGSPPILGAPTALATALGAAGVDVLSVANNHAWDQWARGAQRSVEAVRAAHMGAIGAGPTLDDAFAAHVIESHGLRIAFLAITERVNGGPGHSPPEALIARWDEDAVVAHAVEAARARADVVVVSIHWSHDFWPDPIGQQERRAAFLVEHGADVILGSGPHILHRVSRLPSPRGEAICAYSLGNLISNQGNRYRVGRHAAPGAHPATWLPTTRDGAWLRIPVHVENGRVAIRPMTAVPLFTANNFWAMERRETRDPDIQILPLSAQPDPALVSERRAIIAQTLGPEVTLVER